MGKRQETVLQGPVATLLGQLGTIKSLDDVTEARRRQTGGLALALGIGGFASFFCFPVLGVPLFIGAGIAGYVYSRYVAADLDDDRLDLVQQLLVVLRPDLSEKSPVEVVIRHGDLFRWGTKGSQRAEGNWATGKVTYSEHEDTWLILRGRMTDGSVLKLEISSSAKRKSKPKRKYTKIKDRIQDEVNLTVRVPAERYPHLERFQSALRPEVLQQQAALAPRAVQVQAPSIRVSAVAPMRMGQTLRSGRSESGRKLDVNQVVSLVAFVYGGLGRCLPDGAPAG